MHSTASKFVVKLFFSASKTTQPNQKPSTGKTKPPHRRFEAVSFNPEEPTILQHFQFLSNIFFTPKIKPHPRNSKTKNQKPLKAVKP